MPRKRNENLSPTTIYLDKEVKRQIDRLALATRRTKSEIIREGLLAGLKRMKTAHSPSAKALLDLAASAEKLRVQGPKDLSTDLDRYLWDENEAEV